MPRYYKKRIFDAATPDHPITLSRIPQGAEPVLLPIEDRITFKRLRKDGVGKVLTIVGNLVFQDSKGKPVTSFALPIKVTINYTEDDERAAKGAEIIPVYLYTYPLPPKPPEFNIWKPFQNFTVDRQKRTMTIEVRFWGDEPIGPGTKKGT